MAKHSMGINDESDFFEEVEKLAHKFEDEVKNGHQTVYFDVDDIESLIDYYTATNKLHLAEEVLRYGQELHPESECIKAKTAKIFLLKEQYDKAIEVLASLKTVQGDNIGIWAECIARMGDIEKANKMFRKYLQDCDASEINLAYLDIITLYNTLGHSETAERWLEEACAIYPDDSDLWNERGYTADLMNNPDLAITYYNKALDIAPYRADTWNFLGTIYFKLQNMEKALEAYNFTLSIDHNNILTILQKAHCLFNLGRYEEAKASYKEYLDYDLNGIDAIALTFYAECFENTEMYEKAIELYKRAIEEDDTIPDTWIGLCACYMEFEDMESEALKCAEKANYLQPENVEIIAYLAELHERIGTKNNLDEEYETALNLYLKCIDLDPVNGRYYMEVANIYMQYSMFAKAKEYYEKAYSLDPTLERLTVFLSMACFALNEKEACRKYFMEALDTYPNTKEVITQVFPDMNKWFEEWGA